MDADTIFAAKAGVIDSTKALAKEMASSRMRVNRIARGVIETGMNEGLFDYWRFAATDAASGQ
jgi:NAD(P)-dependent dehydrogenase (short-subunit alcohol dehydrogenase family)